MAEQFVECGAVRYSRHGEAFWLELIERQTLSGVGVRKFCIANGVAPATFHKWRRTLADRKEHDTSTPVATPDAMFIPIIADGIAAANSQEPKAMPHSSPRTLSRDSVIVNSGGVRVELTGTHADRIVRHLLGRMNGLTC
jgi:transposase-like protein